MKRRHKKSISSTEALNIAHTQGIDITKPTVIAWVRKGQLGKKLGGQWFINEAKWRRYLMEGERWQVNQ